jgi:large subunit ribosomal protein L13e
MQVVKPIIKKGHITRKGRGYSLQELQEVNLDSSIARKNGIPVDRRRHTSYPENIEQLKPIQKVIEGKYKKNHHTNNKQ